MPKSGYKQTLEHRNKLSLRKLKNPSKFWLNKKRSKDTKNKISTKLKGRKLSINHKDKIRIGNKGKIRSKEARQKMSISKRGDKSSLWKGGISPKNKIIRQGVEYRLWRESVFARDNWICQKTGIKGGKLNPHHIKNFSQYPELRFAIDNGITLSDKVHIEFHKKYGKQNNTREQIIEFLKKS